MPLWVPVAILLFEKEDLRKRVQKALVEAGLLVKLYLAWSLIGFPVQANIVGYHVAYTLKLSPLPRGYGILLHALSTIIPPFFSPIKRMWMLEVAIAVSYIISAIFYEHYILSVWCFFASVISISVIVAMREINKGHVASISLSVASMQPCKV